MCKQEEELIQEIKEAVEFVIFEDDFLKKMQVVERTVRVEAANKQLHQEELS